MLLIPAHRAYAATMTEDEPLTGGQAERLKAALREMDAKMGHAVHYGPGDVPLYGEGSVRAQWADEQADAVINPGARVFNLQASQISIGVKAATRTAGTLLLTYRTAAPLEPSLVTMAGHPRQDRRQGPTTMTNAPATVWAAPCAAAESAVSLNFLQDMLGDFGSGASLPGFNVLTLPSQLVCFP